MDASSMMSSVTNNQPSSRTRTRASIVSNDCGKTKNIQQRRLDVDLDAYSNNVVADADAGLTMDASSMMSSVPSNQPSSRTRTRASIVSNDCGKTKNLQPSRLIDVGVNVAADVVADAAAEDPISWLRPPPSPTPLKKREQQKHHTFVDSMSLLDEVDFLISSSSSSSPNYSDNRQLALLNSHHEFINDGLSEGAGKSRTKSSDGRQRTSYNTSNCTETEQMKYIVTLLVEIKQIVVNLDGRVAKIERKVENIEGNLLEQQSIINKLTHTATEEDPLSKEPDVCPNLPFHSLEELEEWEGKLISRRLRKLFMEEMFRTPGEDGIKMGYNILKRMFVKSVSSELVFNGLSVSKLTNLPKKKFKDFKRIYLAVREAVFKRYEDTNPTKLEKKWEDFSLTRMTAKMVEKQEEEKL